MRDQQRTYRLLPLLLSILLLLGSLPVSAGAQPYAHDPRLNASAMNDIVLDPEAVYGFSPSPEGGLASYARFNWADSGDVAEYQQNRREFFASYQQMYDLLDELYAAGKSAEEVARAVSAKRNELRLAACDNDPESLAALKERNLERYGHEEGPLPDELYEQYGSWDVVIEKAFSHNAGMDACLGLYDEYYDYYLVFGYVTEESQTKATREYAAAAFAEAAGLAGEGSLSAFRDAGSVSPWFAPSLAAAAEAGVLTGYGDGSLRPGESISRTEALVLLSRCLPELEAVRSPQAFSDVPAWARADIDRLSAAGIVEGYGDGTLGAGDSLSVAQVGILSERVRKAASPAT